MIIFPFVNMEIIQGAIRERDIITQSNQTTSFLWEGENVFSTPSMIAEMEETCRLLLKEQFLQDFELDSVGTLVNVKHLAATPIGTSVHFTSRIIKVNGNRVLFEVNAYDKKEKIGEGIHERYIINIPKFKSKFQQKQNELVNL